jgi:hypothetical protein
MSSLLSERAVLVRPSISVWRGEITDRAASGFAAEHHKAERASVRLSKFLIPKEAIDPILTEAGSLRSFVRQETLPWRWDGVGLLPTENYLPFMDGWRARRAGFDGAVSHLLRRWHIHCAVGQRALGDLAREYDYPTADEVGTKFAVSLEVFPVPDADDFRATVSDAEAEEIRESLRLSSMAELRSAETFLWEQMQECVAHIHERLSAYGKDPDTGKIVGRFHDTLIGNLRSLVSRLSRLNLSGDPAIEAMRQRLEESLCPYDPSSLRDDDELRASVKDEAARIMEQMSSIYSKKEAAE